MNRILHILTALLFAAAVSACGTDSSSSAKTVSSVAADEGSPTGSVTVTLPGSPPVVTPSGSGSDPDPDSGQDSGSGSGGEPSFTLRLTDAPVDEALAVVMEFTEVRLRSVDGEWTSYRFDTNDLPSIDLLALQGTMTEDLLVNMPAAAGEYDEIRLLVSDAQMANYVDTVSGPQQLQVPGGSTSGLKVKGDFMISRTRTTSLIVDFDLRQSVRKAGNLGQFIFRPVLRLANDKYIGHIRGEVDPALLSSPADCSDGDVDSYNAVYIYAGHDAIPVDIGPTEDDEGNDDEGDDDENDDGEDSGNKPAKKYHADGELVGTGLIAWNNGSQAYLYEAAFLPEGDYTVALTCNADQDDLDQGGDDLRFFGLRNVTVVVNDIVFL